MASKARNFRNLDLLRTIAVVCVFTNHLIYMLLLGPLTRSLATGLGRFGVLLFFFHTSFVLTQSLDASGAESPGWALKFYIRRAFRIYPLAIVTVALAIASSVPYKPWDLPWHPDRGILTIAANLLLVQNLLGKPPIIGPFWSLPIEVQMYILLPLVFRIIDHRKWKLRVVLSLTAAAGLAIVVFLVSHHLNLLAFVPCFFSGSLAYKLTKIYKPKWHPFGWFALILGATFLGAIFTLNIPVEWALCFILTAMFPHFKDLRPGWISSLCHEIARYSYGIYLTHLFALWIAFILLEKWLSSSILETFMTVAITGVAAITLFHLVENPMIHLGKKLASRIDDKRKDIVFNAQSPAMAQGVPFKIAAED